MRMSSTLMNDHNLKRFVDAQNLVLRQSLCGIARGTKNQSLDVVHFSPASRLRPKPYG